MAYGFSTLFFLAAIRQTGNGMHTAIDPFEISDWNGIGLEKVREVGMLPNFTFFSKLSIQVLPNLDVRGAGFGVIFIDGNHRFDDVLVDFTLCALACKLGGVIVLDDTWMPSVRRTRLFIQRNRLDFEEIKTSDSTRFAAFRKIGEDKRDWEHYKDF